MRWLVAHGALLRRARRGSAAMEFALIGPTMLILLVATIELVNIIRVQTKLNVAAGQLAEMIANQTSVTEGSAEGPGGTLGDMCTAASYNMLPYKTTSLSGYLESTTVSSYFGLHTVQDWANDKSCPAYIPGGGSFWETILLTNIADTPQSLFTLDGTPKQSGGTMVVGYSAISLQLTYVYTNPVSYFFAKTITFKAVATARPRSNTSISCTYPSGASTAACPGVY